jgi:GNAT superfamily N-acetyltransferase
MISIERITATDGQRLRAIRLRALRDAPDAFASTYEEAAARGEESWSRQLAVLATFVAVEDGHDVGLVRGGPDDARGDTAGLLSMWVAPEARGRGVGIALIDAVIHWARATGYVRVVLDVGAHNEPAKQLYARAGFVTSDQQVPPTREGIPEIRLERLL